MVRQKQESAFNYDSFGVTSIWVQYINWSRYLATDCHFHISKNILLCQWHPY